jgi:very-short-patch-repair endonuclease
MPHHPVPPKNRNFARSMRREPTEAEDRLWGALRGRRLDRIKFRRQVPVGAYIADFVCAEAMLFVEIDGSQDADSIYDAERAAAIKALGFRVLRLERRGAARTEFGLRHHHRVCARQESGAVAVTLLPSPLEGEGVAEGDR